MRYTGNTVFIRLPGCQARTDGKRNGGRGANREVHFGLVAMIGSLPETA